MEPNPSARTRRVLLATQRDRELWRELWPASPVELICLDDGRSTIESLYGDPPDLLVLDYHLPDYPHGQLARLIKSEGLFRRLPVLLILDRADLGDFIRQGPFDVDDFLVLPSPAEEIEARTKLVLSRTGAAIDANPLTRLPGNAMIVRRLQALIADHDEFALAYADLDNFKAFNDKYGFARGDEALVMTSRIIVNSVRSVAGEDAFVGHVGGDDFVFIVPPDRVESVCALVVENFDAIVPHFYDEEDREQGMISSLDRQGRNREYPLMTISIGVVVNWSGKIGHCGEASQMAMALNKKAKERACSCYVVDRRRD